MGIPYDKPSIELSVEPGRLRHWVQIQAPPSNSKDSFGQPLTQWNAPADDGNWATIRNAWASIEKVKGQEKVQGGQITDEVTHEILVRWTATQINPTMRVVYKNEVFKIQDADNVARRNTYIKLMCLAVNQGSNPDAGNAPAGGC